MWYYMLSHNKKEQQMLLEIQEVTLWAVSTQANPERCAFGA